MAHIPAHDGVHFEFHGGEPMLAPLEQMIEVRDHIRTFGPRAEVGITTNLVYKLKQEQIDFFKSLDGFGTSWDPDIRFDNDKQYNLWFANMQTMVKERGHSGVVLNVSVSRQVATMNQEDLIHFLKSTGAYKVLFDRITMNGNAVSHLELFPSNQEINDWYLKMDEANTKLGSRKWFDNAALEDVYMKFENGNSSCGTFCRDCEERNVTINGDGTISGCPNSAQEEAFGNIDMSIPELFTSAKRLDIMVTERVRNEQCFGCSVFNYCGSDCHRLAWDGDICASPRQLMKKLAGQEYLYSATPEKKKRIIPIYQK